MRIIPHANSLAWHRLEAAPVTAPSIAMGNGEFTHEDFVELEWRLASDSEYEAPKTLELLHRFFDRDPVGARRFVRTAPLKSALVFALGARVFEIVYRNESDEPLVSLDSLLKSASLLWAS